MGADVATPTRPPAAPPEGPRARANRWLAAGIVVVTACMVPWVVFLGITLPPDYRVRHWDLLWIGFDGGVVAVLAYTAWAGWFRRRVTVAGLHVAATLLVCDAWFDVVTGLGHRDAWVSVVSALVGELPLAGAFVWLSRRIACGLQPVPCPPATAPPGGGRETGHHGGTSDKELSDARDR